MIEYVIWYEMDAYAPVEEQRIICNNKEELRDIVARYIDPAKWGILKEIYLQGNNSNI